LVELTYAKPAHDMARHYSFCGLMWDADWDVQPDSSFQFLFENVGEGTLTAAHGEWEANSKIGRPPGKGFYRNVTPTLSR
jgi:hypothetical protein